MCFVVKIEFFSQYFVFSPVFYFVYFKEKKKKKNRQSCAKQLFHIISCVCAKLASPCKFLRFFFVPLNFHCNYYNTPTFYKIRIQKYSFISLKNDFVLCLLKSSLGMLRAHFRKCILSNFFSYKFVCCVLFLG